MSTNNKQDKKPEQSVDSSAIEIRETPKRNNKVKNKDKENNTTNKIEQNKKDTDNKTNSNNTNNRGKTPSHTKTKTLSKYAGVKNGEDLSEKNKLIIDEYYNNGFCMSKAVMSVMPKVSSQPVAISIYHGIVNKPTAKRYIESKQSALSAKVHLSIENQLMNHIIADNVTPADLKGVETLEDLAKLPHHVLKNIESWKIDNRTEINRQGNEVKVSTLQFKLVNKMETRKEIAKMTGAYEKHNLQKNGSTLDISKLPVKDQLTLLNILTKGNSNDESNAIDI